MKQTVAAFATGALVASAIAIVMNRRPEPAPAPVAKVVAVPVAPEAKPEPVAEPVMPATREVSEPAEPVRKSAPKAKAKSKPERPVEIARAEPARVEPPRAVPPHVEAPATKPEPAVSVPVPAPAPSVSNAEPAPKPAEPVALNPPRGTATEPAAKRARSAQTLTIPEGTLISVRLLERIASDVHASGDTFSASLSEPLVIDGFAIAEKNARVEGRVVQTEKGGRVKGTSFLSVELTHLSTADGQKVAIRTQSFERKADQNSKSEDAKKVGVGAAIGAAIGAIAGGGKGAAIGAGAGGAAGGGVVLAGRGKPAELPVETRINFRLAEAVTLTEKLSKAN